MPDKLAGVLSPLTKQVRRIVVLRYEIARPQAASQSTPRLRRRPHVASACGPRGA
jgi:hypothetical protein